MHIYIYGPPKCLRYILDFPLLDIKGHEVRHFGGPGVYVCICVYVYIHTKTNHEDCSCAQAFIFLVLLAGWLGQARLDSVEYGFVELFAGEAAVSREFRLGGHKTCALDLAYDDVVCRKGAMDLTTPAGFLLAVLICKVFHFCIRMDLQGAPKILA